MRHLIRDDFHREPLGIADRFFASRAGAHDAGRSSASDIQSPMLLSVSSMVRFTASQMIALLDCEETRRLAEKWTRLYSRMPTRAIMDQMTLHMSEAEVARDLHAVLAKVQQGIEVVIEQDRRPVAVLRAPLANGRLLSECIALAEARGTTAIPDEGFMKDVAEGITERTKPWTPPSWE